LVAQGNDPRSSAATAGHPTRHSRLRQRREIVLDRDGVALYGTVAGTGPTLLLLHAGGERRNVWDPLIEPLTASGMRTVAFDLRGHGDSAGVATSLHVLAADVRAMVEREGAQVILVGASLGGFAALAALQDPSTARRVFGLVLVDVVPDPEPEPVRAWLDARGLLAAHATIAEDILGRGPELLATAKALDMPILLVRGGRSVLGHDDVGRLRRANRRVTMTAVECAGHLVARDAPSELARILIGHASH
jgi:pimeloyl-ACP methyl ester carboxylesterase